MADALRKIIHIDMDAFYASVEQLDHPQWRGLPLAVGGSERRGVIAAASYEARVFGVRSAMSGAFAKKLCPQLIFAPPRFDRYKEISRHIQSIFFEYTDLVEPLSLDEAYLDVTQNKKGLKSASMIALVIRRRIFEELGLYASAGISVNKFVAKVASDVNKPNGQKTVPPDEVLSFIEALDIKKFYGIGKVTTQKMHDLGIFTGADLKQCPLEFLVQHFGKSGAHYYQIVRGIHKSEVIPHRDSKSVGVERTFDVDLNDVNEMQEPLQYIAIELERRLLKKSLRGKTITLKLKYNDFILQTRSKTFTHYVADAQELFNTSISLLEQEPLEKPIRLLGISVSNLKSPENTPNGLQLTFDF